MGRVSLLQPSFGFTEWRTGFIEFPYDARARRFEWTWEYRNAAGGNLVTREERSESLARGQQQYRYTEGYLLNCRHSG
jgi:hypothetical protein